MLSSHFYAHTHIYHGCHMAFFENVCVNEIIWPFLNSEDHTIFLGLFRKTFQYLKIKLQFDLFI